MKHPRQPLAFSTCSDDDACAAWLIKCAGRTASSVPRAAMKMGAAQKSTHLRVRRLPPADLGDGRDDPARQQAAAHRLVLGRLPDGDHSNGISALQLQKQLGIGSYRSAWLLAHKLRASMVDPERNPLSGLVEIDEASLPFRTKDDPPTGGQGRSHDGKMLIVGAIELGDGNIPGRLRLAEISSLRRRRPRASSKPPPIPTPSRKPTAGRLRCGPRRSPQCPCRRVTAAHLVLPWIHQVFSNLKGWARGVYHGCVASICRPISMSSSFASTAAKPATLLSARSSASPPMQNPLPTAC